MPTIYVTTRHTNADVATVARAAATTRAAGHCSVSINDVRMQLCRTGYCARFVRQCHEAALELNPWAWQWNARNAREMESRLRANGKATDDPEPGDIIGLSASLFRKRPSGNDARARAELMRWRVAMKRAGYGHIGVFGGNGEIIENTSSIVRGPGTVVSRLTQVERNVSGYYRVCKSARPLLIIRLPESDIIECDPVLEDGSTRCDLRVLAENLGWTVHPHIKDEGKIYLRPY